MRAVIESVGGVLTRYFIHGAGDTAVLMLHGVGVSSDSWLWTLPALGDDVLCVAPDMLGFGLTEEGAYTGGAPQQHILNHLVELCNHLPVRRLVVVGSSFGSSIACHLGWRMPSKIVGLVLVGCGPALNGVETLSSMYEQSFENGIAAMRNPTLEVCTRRMNNLVFDSSTVPEALLMVQLTLYALPEAADRYERRMRGIKDPEALRRFDITSRAHTITAPTTIVWGRQDVRGKLEEATEVVNRIPNAHMDIFEECGHLPYLEKPTEFNSLLRKFIAKLH
jgi:2-hydroxy-6-oxonona-2,4-dienedioate hydrolase